MYRPIKKYKNKLCGPAVLSVTDCWCRAVTFLSDSMLFNPAAAWAVEACSVSGHPQAETKGLGRYSLGQCQGIASIRGGSGAPQVGRSRHWSKLDEAEASAASHHIQITGTLSSSMVLVSSALPSPPPPPLSSSTSSAPSSKSSALPASDGV